MIDLMEARRQMTRFRREAQYLEQAIMSKLCNAMWRLINPILTL